jgi:arsenate reductase
MFSRLVNSSVGKQNMESTAPVRILFVCTYKGARALVAEEFAQRLGSGKIRCCSSGFEEGDISGFSRLMKNAYGMDIPIKSPESVFKRYRDGETFDFVITLCDEVQEGDCPIFKTNIDTLYENRAKRLSWSIGNFALVEGTKEEKHQEIQRICDQIKSKVASFLEQNGF